MTRPDGNVYYYDPATGALQRNVTVNVDGTDYTVDESGIAAVAAPPAEPVPEAEPTPEAAPAETADGAAEAAQEAAPAPAEPAS